jgi:hypothetical protein
LQIQAGFDFFRNHPTSLNLGTHTTGSDLQRAKNNDRRVREADCERT